MNPKFEKRATFEADEELQAERELEELLEDPWNSFLNEIPENKGFIENADTAREALVFAKKKIRDRIELTTNFKEFRPIEGVRLEDLRPLGFKRIIETIEASAQEIGRGGDAIVVIAKNEIRSFPPEICYKFATKEETPRGRNSVIAEAEIHDQFFKAANELPHSKIGVPAPFYSLEMGDKKLIAMEKLHAKSIDDVLRGNGFVPEWFDIELFCDELNKMIAHFHRNNLYHRDMHLGNIMISQEFNSLSNDKMGYIIDFGLSSSESMEEFAYKKEVAGVTFTYGDDYGIMKEAKRALKMHKERYHGSTNYDSN